MARAPCAMLKYDDVMNKQRTVIYAERQAVLKGADIHEDILKFIDGCTVP